VNMVSVLLSHSGCFCFHSAPSKLGLVSFELVVKSDYMKFIQVQLGWDVLSLGSFTSKDHLMVFDTLCVDSLLPMAQNLCTFKTIPKYNNMCSSNF